ncbi:MAG: hypothetical protein K0S44_514 [Bacteroidetes bacterium]|jgi:uncharacterized delta-60 repeat protein|nr:hypothetical protein [Bacteroidota bacterium]
MKKVLSIPALIFFISFVSLFISEGAKSFAQPGSIDHTFNPSDLGFGSGDGTNGGILSTAIQADGKILFGGYFSFYNSTTRNALVRVDSNGVPDGNFNLGVGPNLDVSTISLQSDGKIIIGGLFTTFNGTSQKYVGRLYTNGTIDNGFTIGTGPNSYVYTSAIQSDGKIIIGGSFTSFNGVTRNRILRLNTNGTLDPSFNPGTGANNTVYKIAVQNDGKIILVGDFTTFNGVLQNHVTRLNTNGTLDPAFTSGTGADNNLKSLAIQNDGKIIIGGYFTSYNGTATNNLARLNSDGTIDLGFNLGSGPSGSIKTISIQANGKIIVAGDFITYNGMPCHNITRLQIDGTQDSTFIKPMMGTTISINSTSIQSNGKIIIGGSIDHYHGVVIHNITRLHADGTLDHSFNKQTGADYAIQSINILSDGKIIIAGGFVRYNDSLVMRITRLHSNGTLDVSFNPGGSGAAGSSIYTTVVQSDGKIIMGGDFVSYNGVARFKIARLNTDGTLDPTFTSGVGVNNIIYSISLQSDGKIIIGGDFTSYGGTPRNRIARLNSDGTLDNTFNPGTAANNYVTSTSIQSDGKIIVGGYFTSFNGNTAIKYLTRLNANGTVDAGFNTGTGTNSYVHRTVLQSDGKIIIEGNFTTYNAIPINRIARLNTDGTIDSGFNPGTGPNNAINTTLIQNDGKYIIGGTFTSYNGVARNYLARLNTDGTLDTSFDIGTGGSAGASAGIACIKSNGKILIGGGFTSYNGTGRNRIARILDCYPSATTDLITACNSYTWIDGNTYTENNNTATHIVPNSTGCDSIITLDLTLNKNSSTDTHTACGSYTWIDGNTYTANNNTATYTLTNSMGCDSVVTLNLTINNNYSTDVQTACDSYTWIDGNTYTANNTTATHTLTNSMGCDSVVTLNLTINNNYSTYVQTACDSYTWIDGNTYTASNTSATHNLTNMMGCDSVVTLNLTVNHSSAEVDQRTACDQFTWIDGITYTSGTNTPTFTFTNGNGCDSVITLNLTIDSVSNLVNVAGSTLSANSSGGTYQWINCTNGNILPGETNQSFTPTANGNYAVIIQQNTCIDTSDCYNVVITGVSNYLTSNSDIIVYPNPFSSNTTITFLNDQENSIIKITDVLGNEIKTILFSGKDLILEKGDMAQGLYFIHIINGNKIITTKRITIQ